MRTFSGNLAAKVHVSHCLAKYFLLDRPPMVRVRWQNVEKSGTKGHRRTMEAAFHGAAVITPDAQGRVAVPPRPPGALGERPLVPPPPPRRVLVFSLPRSEPPRARGGGVPRLHPHARLWDRVVL